MKHQTQKIELQIDDPWPLWHLHRPRSGANHENPPSAFWGKGGMGGLGQPRALASLLFLCLLFLAACSATAPFQISTSPDEVRSCRNLLGRLDREIEEAGHTDASASRVPGFPYLRANRFLSALKKDLRDADQRQQWVEWMEELSLISREKEIRNLPDQAIFSLLGEDKGEADRETLSSRVASCSRTLLRNDQEDPVFYSTLQEAVDVPDEYSSLRRIVGLYPLFVLPIAVATRNAKNKAGSWYEGDMEALPVDGQLRTLIPPQEGSLTHQEVREMIESSRKNPLRVPRPQPALLKVLVQSFAPLFVQDTVAPYDRIGRVKWKGNRIEVDPEKPTVYYYLSHALLKKEPILQINYAVWYPERAGDRPPSIEKGFLDGLTVRVSLDSRGNPFMVDIINNCGCYHLFSPLEERVECIKSYSTRPDPFVPQWLPELPRGKRLGIRINSGWHQVERLFPAEEFLDPVPYELMSYDVLEALPREGGGAESMFDARGIAKNSERKERFILFSMGIPSIGSMRQRGHHAIELIGRSHFDDPDLFDTYFFFK